MPDGRVTIDGWMDGWLVGWTLHGERSAHTRLRSVPYLFSCDSVHTPRDRTDTFGQHPFGPSSRLPARSGARAVPSGVSSISRRWRDVGYHIELMVGSVVFGQRISGRASLRMVGRVQSADCPALASATSRAS